MKVTREDLEHSEVSLNIEVEEEDIEPYLQRAYQRVVGRVNIPGFRKGKAPRPVLERFVGRQSLEDDALDLMLPEIVQRAIEEQDVKQASIPQVELVEREPIVIKASVPIAPEVVLNAYREIRVPVEPVVVTEDQINTLLDLLRRDTAPWEPVDRPVAMDDQVIMDIKATLDGQEITRQEGVVYMVMEGNVSPVAGFPERLVGINSQETKEFTISMPEDYPDRELAGKDVEFSVTIHEIKAKNLPDLDDEFAKGVGEGYDNLEALTTKLREDFLVRGELEAREKYEDQVFEQLLEKANINLSPLMVEHEVDHMLQNQEQALRRQQVSVEQYLQTVGKSPDEHRGELRQAAEARLKRTYAIVKVAELEGIKVSPEEIEEEINRLIDAAGPTQPESFRHNIESDDGRESLEQILTRRKALQRLVEVARGEHGET